VFAGCEKPMQRDLVTAENVHGRTGIDGADIHEPKIALQAQHAVDFIIDTLMAADQDSITLVPIGPLSNIGTAISKQPEILPKIREIVLMGGASREGGNTTPSAEFNIYVDPHAADIVMRCGRPIVIAGLDVSHQVLVKHDCLDRLRAMDSKVAKTTLDMLAYFNRHDSEKYGTEGAPLHDPCTIAYLLKPELFKGKQCNVEVETESPLTLGHTAVDFWGVTGRPANATWLYSVDAAGFFDLLLERLSRY
jgi:purine nucleosidase